jgi:glycosyltransferase involved in cell wall biosynthesis
MKPNKPIKLAVIGTRGYPYIYSGYETFVSELVERISKHDVEITVYCHKNLFSSYPKRVNNVNLIYFRTLELKSFSQLIHSFQSMIHAAINDSNIILVVNSANGPFGIISKLLKKKSVINVDGLEWLRPKWSGLGAKYFLWASKMSTKLYDEVITDSIGMAQVYSEKFNCSSKIIAYGANIAYTSSDESQNSWGLRRGDYYLIVGRLIPDNNADIVLREFVASNSSKRIVIVGDVPYKDNYASEIKIKYNDPRILFTGYITDKEELSDLFLNSFVYIHGHEYGGTNPTMLQALASGCGIYAIDTIFTREMLSNGDYGLLFTKEENSLKCIIEDNEKNEEVIGKLKKKARDQIKNNYTWEKIANQYLELFHEMLKG